MDESLKDLNEFLLSNCSEDIISSVIEHNHLTITIVFSSLEKITSLIKINNVYKSYAGGFEALKGVNLEIKRGEILALLGPNGAGKTTLINAICGVVIPSSGNISVDGHDVVKDFRHTRSLIGLVPQELQLEAFEQVFQNISFHFCSMNGIPKGYLTKMWNRLYEKAIQVDVTTFINVGTIFYIKPKVGYKQA